MSRTTIAAVIGAVWIALAAGCKDHDQLKVDVVCEVLCRCQVIDAAADCAAECSDEIEPNEISEDCFQCFLEEGDTCSTLEARCEPACDQPPPPENLP